MARASGHRRKKCRKCRKSKLLREFNKRKDSRDGYRNSCKKCDNKARKKNYNKNGRVKTNHYKNYGLTLEEYLVIREQRKKAPCEICGKRGRMNIDHDHSTGKMRGFLCHGCNTGLGLFEDNPELLEAAIEYLKTK